MKALVYLNALVLLVCGNDLLTQLKKRKEKPLAFSENTHAICLINSQWKGNLLQMQSMIQLEIKPFKNG